MIGEPSEVLAEFHSARLAEPHLQVNVRFRPAQSVFCETEPTELCSSGGSVDIAWTERCTFGIASLKEETL